MFTKNVFFLLLFLTCYFCYGCCMEVEGMRFFNYGIGVTPFPCNFYVLLQIRKMEME